MSIIYQPFVLFMIPVVAASLILMGLVVKYHRAAGTWISRCGRAAWKKLATKAAFFWFVNLVFMAVSVLHAGLFFALLEPANGLLGLAPLLGFAVALTLDLASIVFMQARLSALRMHEQRSAGWYLFSIIACSGLSAFGNLAMSLQDFQPGSLNRAGRLIQAISPWLGVAFPLLIILISIASDKVLDVDPTEHLDVEAYRKLEQKRIAILVERNTFLEQQVEQDRRRADIKRREKDSKRRKRGPSPQTTPPSPTELEQVMARFETLQEQVLTRLVPSTHNEHLTDALVNSNVNSISDTSTDATRSGEETVDEDHRETIPITHWRAEGVESEQETHQPSGGMENRKVFPERVAEQRWNVSEEGSPSSGNGHLAGQDCDPLANTSPDTAVNRRASTEAHHTGNTEQTAGEPSSEHFTEYLGEQEEQADALLNVNSTVNTQAPTFPSTKVNSQAHTFVSIPSKNRAPTTARGSRRSGTGQGSADKPRGEASQRVRRVLKKHPTLSITRLAEKANVSRGYASQVRAQVLSEHQRDPSPGA
jgi:hypothetical protein